MTDTISTVSGAPVSAARVMRRCEELARCSDSKTGLTRLFLSPATRTAHDIVAAWMREAGMTVRTDALGNLIGRFSPRNADSDEVFLLGSHLDTVPNAGKYDGILGVLLGIETVARLGEALPFAVEVIAFSEEEGVRFKFPFLGSRAVAGTFEADFLEMRDRDGFSLREIISDFGLSPQHWAGASHQNANILGYLEAHIEQGPVLEERGAALAIVTDIAGQTRLQARFCGQVGHAGTLPMHGRRDALTALSEWILAVEAHARRVPGLVATVGWVEVGPNTPNVVAGSATCSLDVRHADDLVREKAVEELLEAARDLAERRDVGFETLARTCQAATPMNEAMRRDLHRVCDEIGVPSPEMVSGAGHDAAVMASLCPVAMLFLRTPGGASHCPQEAVLREDVALALDVMERYLRDVAG